MEPANIEWGFRLLTVSQAAFITLLLVLSANPVRVRFAGTLFLLASISYLTLPLFVGVPAIGLKHIVTLFSMVAPALLLVFSWFLFEENRKVPLLIQSLVLIDFVASAWGYSQYLQSVEDSASIMQALQIAKFLLIAVTIYIVWSGRDDDLVERRLFSRFLFVGILIFIILSIISIELLPSQYLPESIQLWGMGILFLLALLANVALVRLNPRMQLVGIAKPIKESSDDPILSLLLKRMRNERLYADHDLRIGMLADIVGLPEYQLRKKINQDLGYRNFNQFVNRFRIMEAGSRLLANQRVPILTIALDVGFRSMSAFNAAFHNHYQLNPTDYRLQSLSDL